MNAAARTLVCLSTILLLAACRPRAVPDDTSKGAVAPTAATAADAPGDVPDRSPTLGAMAPSGGPVDVRPLNGQSEAGVSAMLGEPAACQDAPDGRTCRYARGRAEVVFVNGMAVSIRVGDLGGAPFAPGSLERLGIGPAEPVSSDAKEIHWRDVDGFSEVTMVAGAGGAIDHVQLKAMTP